MGAPTGQIVSAHLARLVVRLTIGTAVEVRVMGLENIPRVGSAILASNHISHFDPPLLGAWLPRRVDWMAMQELFANPIGAAVLRAVGAFEVNRDGSDRKALRVALRRLKDEGAIIGIFPEGGIRAGAGSILNGAEMRPGAAALATLSGVPVIPCAIFGSDRLYHGKNWLPFRRVRVWIALGCPMVPPEGVSATAARNRLQTDLARAFVNLQHDAIRHFGLNEADLPTSPQARKGADPEPFRRRR